LLRPSGFSSSGTPFLGLTMLLEGSRASDAHWRERRRKRQTMLASSPPCGRTSTMQKLEEPFAPVSAAKESLPWPVSLAYHGSQHLTSRCSELSGGVAFSDHN